MANSNIDDLKKVFEATSPTIASIENSNSKRNEPSGKCPICFRAGKYFHCVDCVRNGDFIHSKKMCFDRFADKKLKKYKLNEKLSTILHRYDIMLSRHITTENLKKDIVQCQERILFLKECIKCCRENLLRGQMLIEDLSAKNNEWRLTQTQYRKKIQSMEDNKVECEMCLMDKSQQLLSVHCILKDVINQNAEELVTHIFPITKLEIPKISYEGGQCAELEEARQTTYVKGHWILSGSSADESQYCVVEPYIPGSGDYSAYTSQCTKCADGLSLTQKEQYQQYIGYGIGAALTYTAHLVSVLSFYLDAHLPKNLNYSEFCGPALEKEEFLHKVAKLNANIIHMCLSQNVDLTLIHPHRTIPNLLLLLGPNTSDLGRFQAFEGDQNLMQSIENSLSKDLLIIDESEPKNCDDTEHDWVKISDFDDVPTSAMPNELLPSQTSFISSVASFWRAATGHK